MLFLSTFENKIDAKGRVSIPASFRNTLARSNGGLVLYPNMLKPFIEGCDTNRMAQYAEAADQLDQTSEDAEAYFAMMASAREMRIDSDGRIMLTDELIACAGLSDEALYYIGGIIKHARAINAFANASTNSYKRLVPGFEAPVMLAYSARNRSASIRIPFVSNPKARRIEVRFGDNTANPYLCFAAMLMAGLDGIKNKIEPVGPLDKDLYDLPAEELKDLPSVCSSLEQALDALDNDREFLNQGDVFTNDMIDGYIELKNEEVEKLNMTTHPVEFEMYYSV